MPGLSQSGTDASPKTIVDLCNGILFQIKVLNKLNEEVEQQYKKLGQTFQDEGYVEIGAILQKNKKAVYNAMPGLEKVCDSLINYAQALYVSLKETSQ